MTVRTQAHYLALLLTSIVCVSASWSSLSLTLVANCLERGSSTFVIGILTSIWTLPFLVAAPLYTRVVSGLGAKPCLLTGMLSDSLLIWAFPLFPNDWTWVILQLLSGVMLGHFWLITEAWLNLLSKEHFRGRIMSLYGILPSIGYALGAGLYTAVGPHGYAPFLAAAVTMALGGLPILAIPKGAVDIVLGADERIRRALGRAPLLLSVAFLAGILEMVPWSLLQVYAKESRWTAQGIALALPLFYGGQILLTYPLGWMADRTARRSVLIGTSAVAIVCMSTMALLTRSPEPWAITFLMGGFATVTYTLGLAILGQQFKSDALLSVNAAYLASYCVGTILGPPIVGHAMDQHGPVALPIALATVNALVLGCACAARMEWQHHRRVSVELSV